MLDTVEEILEYLRKRVHPSSEYGDDVDLIQVPTELLEKLQERFEDHKMDQYDTRKYRLVSDYGYGDKSWLERMLSASEAIRAFNERTGHSCSTIEACQNSSPVYTLEVDNWEDKEDWDWMDS